MTPSVVKCGVFRKEGLSTTFSKMGRLICTNCGQEVSDQLGSDLDTRHHIFYEFIGAYCPLHQAIHYRWTNRDWELMKPSPLREVLHEEPIILPRKTELGLEDHFVKNYFWETENGCMAPGYLEVLWNDFSQSKQVLLRPSDTGFRKISRRGIHAPFIASLIEWLLKVDQWTELGELAKHSLISAREKKVLQKAVVNPTPSNIFNMLWSFRRYIPDWNNSRSLGRRPPSMLILDEIRWATNRISDIDSKDRERLERCGPEPNYWGAWQELWPEDIPIDGKLAEIGKYFYHIGIRYDDELELITLPDTKSGERSWIEIADKLINWPVVFNTGGSVDQEHSIRGEYGFVPRLKQNLSIAVHKDSNKIEKKWKNYLKTNLPLCWLMENTVKPLKFSVEAELVELEDLQDTLSVLQPWIHDKIECEVVFEVMGKLDQKLQKILENFGVRIADCQINLIYDQ